MRVVDSPGLARLSRSAQADYDLLNALRRSRSLYHRDDDEADDDPDIDALLQLDELEEPEPAISTVTETSRGELQLDGYDPRSGPFPQTVLAPSAPETSAHPSVTPAPVASPTAPAIAVPIPMPEPAPLPQAAPAIAVPIPMPEPELLPQAVAAISVPIPIPVPEPAPAAPAPIASPAAPVITIESAPRARDAGRKQRPLPSWVVLLVLGSAVAVTWFTVSRESPVSPAEKSASSVPARQQAARPVIAPVASTRAATPQPPVAPRPVAPARTPVVGFAASGRIVVPESKHFITIKVRSAGRLREPVQLSVTAVSGSAKVNEDFVPPVGHLTLTPQKPSADVLVSLLRDNTREKTEEFTVVLGVERGRATLDASKVVVALNDK